uniref:RRM domain-containing protein n=1 Tax=Graphocephala atropunctata TaxID=36148 RepID=A0A1B6M4Z8_9HEMI
MGTRVFVGGLTYRVRERDLERFFRKYGRIKEVAMKNGFAFVEFDDHRDADDAVYELNGKELLGERVSVEKARGTPRGSDVWRGSGHGRSLAPLPRRPSRARDREPDHRISDRYGPPTRTEYRLIVENLSTRVSWQDLKDYMRQAGEVTYADAHKDRRNEGVVEFATSSDMKNALDKLDDTELNGRRIRLVEDRRNSRRSRSSSSRSRSRSRSRRRSRSRERSRSPSKEKSKSRSHSPEKNGDRSPEAKDD